MNDEFELWNLKVEVVGDESAMICKHTVGDSFDVCGEDITFSRGGFILDVCTRRYFAAIAGETEANARK